MVYIPIVEVFLYSFILQVCIPIVGFLKSISKTNAHILFSAIELPFDKEGHPSSIETFCIDAKYVKKHSGDRTVIKLTQEDEPLPDRILFREDEGLILWIEDNNQSYYDFSEVFKKDMTILYKSLRKNRTQKYKVNRNMRSQIIQIEDNIGFAQWNENENEFFVTITGTFSQKSTVVIQADSIDELDDTMLDFDIPDDYEIKNRNKE